MDETSRSEMEKYGENRRKKELTRMERSVGMKRNNTCRRLISRFKKREKERKKENSEMKMK